jgi:hypothetical protein
MDQLGQMILGNESAGLVKLFKVPAAEKKKEHCHTHVRLRGSTTGQNAIKENSCLIFVHFITYIVYTKGRTNH